MNAKTLDAAITEARRFLDRAVSADQEYRLGAAKQRLRDACGCHDRLCPKCGHYYPSGAVLASCRRASMDLTRALAKMRRPG